MLSKLNRYPQDGPHVFIDPDGDKEFVADAQETFEKALSNRKPARFIDVRLQPLKVRPAEVVMSQSICFRDIVVTYAVYIDPAGRTALAIVE